MFDYQSCLTKCTKKLMIVKIVVVDNVDTKCHLLIVRKKKRLSKM